MSDGFEEIVRPAQAQRSEGFRPPPTKGLNPETAVMTVGDSGASARDPAVLRNDQVFDGRLWPSMNMAHGATEDVVAVLPATDAIEIDVSVASVVVLNVVGDSVNVTFAAFPELPSDQSASIWGLRSRSRIIELIIHWLDSSTGRSVNLDGVMFSEGAEQGWSTAAGAYDILLIQKLSTGQMFGFQIGEAMAVPA